MLWIHRSTWLLLFSLVLLATHTPLAGSTTPSTVDSCGVGTTGNVDATGIIDLSDLSLLITYMTQPSGTVILPCADEANVNATGIIDLSDLSLLITYLTVLGTTLPQCPNAKILMPAVQRATALAAAQQEINSLKGLPTDQFLQQMAAYFQSNPAYAASGINAGARTVWARFTDGVGFTVARSLEFSPDTLAGDSLPTPVSFDPLAQENTHSRSAVLPGQLRTLTPAATGSGDDLPNSTSVRIVQSVGNGFPSVGVTTRRLISWFTSNGYFVTSTSGSIAALRSVGGDGVFYFLGHGEAEELQDGSTEYCISTTNDALTASQVSTYENDLAAGRLTIMAAPFDYDATQHEVWGIRFGITRKFVSTYWHDFAPNAVVFINACRSDSATSFKAAVQAKGGPAYFGWTRIVNCIDACDAAEFMIDRMLGANKHYRKETPPQRPFEAGVVYSDLESRGLCVRANSDADAGFKTVFRYTPGSGNFGLLAPSIKFLSVADDPQVSYLYIAGSFGTDPGEGNRRVTVDGQEAIIDAWLPYYIECEIPAEGAGSAGPVVVESRADVGSLTPLSYRKSNVVNITSWQGQLRYDRAEAGTLHETMTVDLVIRADIHAFRDIPHEKPWETIVEFSESSKANAHAQGSGAASYSMPGFGWSMTWGGTHELGPPLTSEDVWGYNGSSIDTKGKKLSLNMIVGTDQLSSVTTYVYDPGGTYTYPGTLSVFLDTCLYDDLNMVFTFFMPMDSAFNVTAGSRSCGATPFVNPEMSGVPEAAVQLQWPRITATFPPDTTAAQ